MAHIEHAHIAAFDTNQVPFIQVKGAISPITSCSFDKLSTAGKEVQSSFSLKAEDIYDLY